MFENYSVRARRVIFFARYEASAYGADQIEAEHLYLGVCREWNDVVTIALREMILKRLPQRSPVPTSLEMPLSHQAVELLNQVEGAAFNRNSTTIDIEDFRTVLIKA